MILIGCRCQHGKAMLVHLVLIENKILCIVENKKHSFWGLYYTSYWFWKPILYDMQRQINNAYCSNFGLFDTNKNIIDLAELI